MKKNKKFIIPIICVAVMLTVLSAIRIYQLNTAYPNPYIAEHSANEIIEGGNISISVVKSKLADGSYINSIFPDYIDRTQNDDGTKVTNEQIRVLLIYTKLINSTNEEQRMSIVQMYAESLVWSNGIDAGLYPLLNPNSNNPMEVVIPANKEVDVIMPYSMYNFQFNETDWKNVDNRNFNLTLSSYPVKHIVKLPL